jgi:hypothetical protein
VAAGLHRDRSSVRSTPARMLRQDQLLVDRYPVHKITKVEYPLPQNLVTVQLSNQMTSVVTCSSQRTVRSRDRRHRQDHGRAGPVSEIHPHRRRIHGQRPGPLHRVHKRRPGQTQQQLTRTAARAPFPAWERRHVGHQPRPVIRCRPRVRGIFTSPGISWNQRIT